MPFRVLHLPLATLLSLLRETCQTWQEWATAKPVLGCLEDLQGTAFPALILILDLLQQVPFIFRVPMTAYAETSCPRCLLQYTFTSEHVPSRPPPYMSHPASIGCSGDTMTRRKKLCPPPQMSMHPPCTDLLAVPTSDL